MHNFLLKLYLQMKDLVDGDEGQDLVEYALVVALIAFGATAGMSNLATGISTVFSNFGIKLGTIVT
jgi:pilus assembly protein Flp/PilA